MKIRVLALLLGALSTPSFAADQSKEEQTVRAALTSLVPGGMSIESVRPSPVPGFYEVGLSGMTVVYVSTDGKYLLQGTLLDIASRENLTENARAGQRRGMLQAVKNDQAILFSPKDPKYTVTVFTDVDCGYCRRLHQQIAEYNGLGIAVKYLFFPRAGLSSASYTKAVSVWCAPDRLKAMTEAKAGTDLPAATCDNPIANDFALGQEIGVEGTPAIYNADGVQLGGYLPPQQMLARLNDLAARAPR